MKKMRSLLSVMLVLSMLISMFAFPTNAEVTVDGDAAEAESEAIPAPKPITDITKEDGTPIKVACVGDSITYGYKIVTSNEDGSLGNVEYTYPAKLGNLLGEGYEVANFGKSSAYLLADDNPHNAKSGTSYKDMAEYTASIEYAPDVVIIMLGTNDIRSMVTEEANIAVKDALVDLVNIYQALESVQRVYVVSSIYTQLDNAVKHISDGTLQNIQYQAAVESGAEYVDIFSLTRDYFDVMLHRSDRLHPNVECSDAIPDAIHALLTGSETYVAPEAPTAEVVYVSSASNANYTNDALTPDTPTNSLPYAAGLVRNGGTIVVSGVYNLYNASQGTHMPDTNGLITITSVYGGVDYGAAGAKINMNSGYLYLGGDTVFENIKLASTSSSMIMCNYHNVTFEESVVCAATSGVQNPIIVAGYNVTNGGDTVEQVSFGGTCNIVINGGNWHYVRNGNRRASATSTMGAVKEGASVTMTVNGGIFESTDYQNNNSATGMNNVYGDCSLIINGGSFPGRVYAVNRAGDIASGDGTAKVTGKVTLAVNGGAMVRGNVFALHYNGTNVNIDDADIKLVVSTRYSDSMDMFEGFENIVVAEDNFVIASAEDLLDLMADSSKWGGYYVLTDDIDLTGVTGQSCIGTDAIPFTGCFDGAGHTIDGVNIVSDKSAGLFGAIRGAEVRNLTVKGSAESTYAAATAETSASIGYVSTGLLIGRILSNSNVYNCVAYGTTKGNGNVGGMFGMINHTGEGLVKVSFCDNYAVPTNSVGNTGGLMSRISANGALINTVSITDCNNYADISSTSTDRCRVAGIVGYMLSKDKSVIARCNNYGNISGYNLTTSTSAPYVGGIGGRWEADTADGLIEIRDCNNYGAVNSTYVAAGVIGYLHHQTAAKGQSTITRCTNSGTVTCNGTNACKKYNGGIIGLTNLGAKFNACYNYGAISTSEGASQTKYAAGILGFTNNATSTNGSMINCKNSGVITVEGSGSLCAGGVVGEQLRLDLENCYNDGNVVCAVEKYRGAITGFEKNAGACTTTNCYALAGTAEKLVGTASKNCTETNILFITEEEQGLKETFVGFDFTSVWTIKDGAPALDCYTASATGDVDADGIVTNADIILAIRHLANWDIEYRADRFDLNGDGKLTNRDVIALIISIAE